jgi:hypothetical protein
MEQPPLTMPSEQREYLARQLTALNNADYAQLPVLTALPSKPLAGKLYYFANTVGITITQIGLWAYTGSGWQSYVNLTGGVVTGQLQLTGANNTATGGGQLYLNGATGNRIDFATAGSSAPAFTTRSAGTKIVLYPFLSASAVDYALGISPNTLWQSVPTTAQSFKWYGGTTLASTLTGAGDFSCIGTLQTSGPTSGIGYATGAGGTVTQATSKATGVTLNKVCGTITMNGAALAAATAVSFTLTNSTIAATDMVVLNIIGTATNGAYVVNTDAISAGSCVITLRNLTAGSLSEAVGIRFGVFNGVNA